MIGLLDKIKAYGFMALAGVLAVTLGLQTWRLHTAQIELADERVSIAHVRTTAALDLATAEGKARITEETLNKSAAQTRKTTNAQIRDLDTQRSTLLDRVLIAEASAASSDVSQADTDSSDGPVAGLGNGAGVLGTLGSADVEEATRADTIRVHLKACYADYNRVAEALNQ